MKNILYSYFIFDTEEKKPIEEIFKNSDSEGVFEKVFVFGKTMKLNFVHFSDFLKFHRHMKKM